MNTFNHSSQLGRWRSGWTAAHGSLGFVLTARCLNICTDFHQEWKHQLRSAVHPAIFAIFYYISSHLSTILRLTPGSHAELLIATPKVVQSIFAAAGDYYIWKLGQKVYGRGSNEAWGVVCSFYSGLNASFTKPVRSQADTLMSNAM